LFSIFSYEAITFKVSVILILQMACQKIISGSQTGVDMAALDAALENNFPCGGYCPQVRLAEDGIIPQNYHLQELNGAITEQEPGNNLS
jgi:hypothetical protein